MIDKNSLFTGIVIGAIVPVLGYIVVETIFDLLGQLGLMQISSGGPNSHRIRTLALLGICSNLIPFNISRKYRLDDTMRGIVFPTLVYVGAWVYKYYSVLF
jgi:hypothetical protein